MRSVMGRTNALCGLPRKRSSTSVLLICPDAEARGLDQTWAPTCERVAATLVVMPLRGRSP
jgi:hypothetical protein